MSRLGKRERALRKDQWKAFREVRGQVIADNVANMPVQGPRIAGVPYHTLQGRSCQLTKDNLFGHSHTKGAYVGNTGIKLNPTDTLVDLIGQSMKDDKQTKHLSKPKVSKQQVPGRWKQQFMAPGHEKLGIDDPKAAPAEVWRGQAPKGERIV